MASLLSSRQECFAGGECIAEQANKPMVRSIGRAVADHEPDPLTRAAQFGGDRHLDQSRFLLRSWIAQLAHRWGEV